MHKSLYSPDPFAMGVQFLIFFTCNFFVIWLITDRSSHLVVFFKKLFRKVPYRYVKYTKMQVFSDPYFPLTRTESSILPLYGKVQGKWKSEFWHILHSAWFKEKHLQWSPNFSKVTKLWILKNFSEQLPYRTPPEDYFCQKQPPEVSCKKDVLKIFAICTESTCFGIYF